ncbi:hypothetical protein [Paraburkholderia kirstenboschensis]|uniref:Tyr recombinase domain-containing protein n=1 Tax=Paraburkholderia kirstenboschensis TaxID=1245436 RepID=A0ABZ0EM77_9BURK|nr:hypothetical protein [Paraburkholderia kirstenboschensis]WOD18266.1 hypothetical protein RW095_36520 [Paraburkholderia kirstenboschensis]
MDSKPLPQTLVVQTVERVYGKLYKEKVRFDISALRLRQGSWMYCVLEEINAKQRRAPFRSQDMQTLRSVVNACCEDPATRAFLTMPIGLIGRREISRCFSAMELVLVNSFGERWRKPGTLYVGSNIFRRFMVEKMPPDTFVEDVRNNWRYFKTTLRSKRLPRKTLSEDSRSEGTGHLGYPLGSTPHQTIRELRDREIERMTVDVNRLRDGCRAEMLFWREARDRMHKCCAYRSTDEDSALARAFLLGGYDNNTARKIRCCSTAALVSSIVEAANDVSFPRHPTKINKHNIGEIADRVINAVGVEKERMEGLRYKHVFFLTRCVHKKEMLCAFYSLLIHTRFNADALRAIRREWITKEGDIYTLKSYKQKTGQETPRVDITKENLAAYEAIELMLWNYEQMKKFGHIGKDEKKIWICWDNTRSRCLKYCFTNASRVKTILERQFGMHPFSDEQIRTHMLTLDNFKTGSVSYVKQEAGHEQEATTHHYISQFSTFLHSQAVNLEFQRRLDSTIKFALSTERIFFADKFSPEYVDKNLLFPIGDGTSCTNPFSPPDPAWLTGGACDAKRCHIGQGCEKNRTVITKARVREVWATCEFYSSSWHRLLNENEEAFIKYHAPSMLFNLALKQYIQSSSHWIMIKRAVIDEEFGNEKDETCNLGGL